MLKLSKTNNPEAELSAIAKGERQPFIRRIHAMALLATFKTSISSSTLREVATDSLPALRCQALQYLVESEGQSAIPFLIKKLDDRDVCMTTTITDPARQFPVYVSDEAVRLLEMTAMLQFEKNLGEDMHRATAPWKEWWAMEGNKRKYP